MELIRRYWPVRRIEGNRAINTCLFYVLEKCFLRYGKRRRLKKKNTPCSGGTSESKEASVHMDQWINRQVLAVKQSISFELLHSNASVQPIECLLSEYHRPVTAGHFRSLQDFSAETEDTTHTVSIATPPCHLLPTNQDTLIQPSPSTSGHINNFDMGWRNASRSISQ
ncbi:hypothetical protein TNCV_2836471 [Trichonephila clavipes]|nr:hypothetical protein TNCV_2836471 [Trichonephila clavipes]